MLTTNTIILSCGPLQIMERFLTTVKKIFNFIFDQITIVVILIIR